MRSQPPFTGVPRSPGWKVPPRVRSAQKHSKGTPWGTFQPGPLGTHVNGSGDRKVASNASSPGSRGFDCETQTTPPFLKNPPPALREEPDMFKHFNRRYEGNGSVRPKCRHRCFSLTESPLKPVLILKHATGILK